MTSLTKRDLEYINNFYIKDGNIEVKDVDRNERLCIVSVPVIDGQEDLTDPHKVVKIPIDYINYGCGDIDLFNVPSMFDVDDIEIIRDAICYACEDYEEDLF